MKINYSFYLILDDAIYPWQNMVTLLDTLADCGITCVQLRMKQTARDNVIAISHACLDILKPKQIPLIINDHVDILEKVNADGVHLGQNDMAIKTARDYLGNEKIIGLSIENIAQAKLCFDAPVNYFGVGPIFATTTKKDAASPIGLQTMQQITIILNKPVVAIGGINLANITAILKQGAEGVAIISAILNAVHPEIITKEIAKIIQIHREKS